MMLIRVECACDGLGEKGVYFFGWSKFCFTKRLISSVDDAVRAIVCGIEVKLPYLRTLLDIKHVPCCQSVKKFGSPRMRAKLFSFSSSSDH